MQLDLIFSGRTRRTLLALAFALGGTQVVPAQVGPFANNVLFVDASSTAPIPNGTLAAPYPTLNQAITHINTQPVGPRVQVNVAPGTYQPPFGLPFVIPDGTILESEEGFSQTTLMADWAGPVVVMEPGDVGSELRGFKITGGGTGVLVPTEDEEGFTFDNKSVIEDNLITQNDKTNPFRWAFSTLTPVDMVGVYLATSTFGQTNRALVRHNRIVQNFDDSNLSFTLGVGIVSSVDRGSTNAAVIEGNFICDHEQDIYIHNDLGTGLGNNETLVKSNILTFAETIVLIDLFDSQGITQPKLINNTIAYGRPSSANLFDDVVVGLWLEGDAAPLLANNILWVPDPTASYLATIGRGIAGTFFGIDVLVQANGGGSFWTPWITTPNPTVAVFTGLTYGPQNIPMGPNAYHNGLGVAQGSSAPTRFPVPSPFGVTPQGIQFVADDESLFFDACNEVDLHLVGYDDSGDPANELLIDQASSSAVYIGDGSGPLDQDVSIDVDADPRKIQGHVDDSCEPDFGGDEYAWVRVEWSPDPTTSVVPPPSFEAQGPLSSAGPGVFGNFDTTEPTFNFDFVLDPNHPWNAATIATAWFFTVGEGNELDEPQFCGNFLFPWLGGAGQYLLLNGAGINTTTSWPGFGTSPNVAGWPILIQGLVGVADGVNPGSFHLLNRVMLRYKE